MVIRLFLAHSFAALKYNRDGEPDPNGISDMELADLVTRWIHDRSRGRIEVVRTLDPCQGYISSTVRHDICSCDAILCLFTKRVKDHVTHDWITSTYVISEAAAALMQFPTEDDGRRRLFGLVEHKVDATQLGMAFPTNQAAPRFHRDDRDGLKAQIERIVDTILKNDGGLGQREGREYLSMDKVALIWRSGKVWVQTRHRYRFTETVHSVRIPHRLWRVSESLPKLEELLGGSHDSNTGFLRVLPIRCGQHEPAYCPCTITPDDSDDGEFEKKFYVEFPQLDLNPGDQLAYEVAWGYPRAFRSPVIGSTGSARPNSVGLRASERGRAASVSLTLQFERDWRREPQRILEGRPRLFTSLMTELPDARRREDVFHDSKNWRGPVELPPCKERSSTMAEVYHWSTGPFLGMAKVTWDPHMNYFKNEAAQSRAATKDSKSTKG